MIMRYLTMGIGLLAFGALTYLYVSNASLRAENASLSAENASLTRSIAVLVLSRAQARDAAEVAKAEADRQRLKANELDALRARLIEGDEDVELPPEFAAWLNDLLGRMP